MVRPIWPGVQLSYRVVTNGGQFNPKVLDQLGLNVGELRYSPSLPGYPEMPLTAGMLDKVKAMKNVVSVDPVLDTAALDYREIFPFSAQYSWTRDYFGPLWIPREGATVEITPGNIPLYERIIRDYEHSSVEEALESGSYTFKQDYYFMMGDNRHNSLDSRYWGFVPEDHIVGRPSVIWLSTDAGRKFPSNIRWRRFLKFL